MVKIGHARSSETKSKNGVAGDQTKNEVSITDWYDGNWKYVFRPKLVIDAETIAFFVEQCCANDHIGYSQNDRLSLFNTMKKYNSPVLINEDCNCDCSSLVMTALYHADIIVDKHMYTGTEKYEIESTGKFTTIIDEKVLKDPEHLKRGDILLKDGHTSVVLSNGSKIVNSVQKTRSDVECKYRNLKYNAVFYCTTDCNMREFPSLDGLKMCILPKGHEVRCYGYYNVDSRNVNWLYVETKLNGIRYYGFVSKRCLSE